MVGNWINSYHRWLSLLVYTITQYRINLCNYSKQGISVDKPWQVLQHLLHLPNALLQKLGPLTISEMFLKSISPPHSSLLVTSWGIKMHSSSSTHLSFWPRIGLETSLVGESRHTYLSSAFRISDGKLHVYQENEMGNKYFIILAYNKLPRALINSCDF